MSSPATRTSKRLSEIALFTGGAIFGASTPVGREMGVWMHPVAITAVRFTLALPFCLIGLRRAPRIINASLLHLVPVGLLYGIAATLFTFAIFHASIAVDIFGYYLANLLSSLVVGVWRYREPLDRPTALAFACSVLAVALISVGQGGDSHSGGQWSGFLLAVSSGLCATVIAREQKRVSRSFDGETITLGQVVGGAAFCWIAVLVTHDDTFTRLSPVGGGLALLYGLMFWACHRLMAFGFRDGPIGIGSILLSVEVIVGPLLAWAFFREAPGALVLAGGILTGFAIIAAARRSPAGETDRETARAT